jgi:hypothetical protein
MIASDTRVLCVAAWEACVSGCCTCRLLPGGLEAKLVVDRCVSLVKPVGDLLSDIAACKVSKLCSPSLCAVVNGL